MNTIWMCWFQGEDDPGMPKLNRTCIKRWKELNPDWKVNVLCDKTIADYVPEYFDILKASPNRGWTERRQGSASSDLLRILLLSKFGGIWVDASVYPMLPLSKFYNKVVNNTGFFSFRFVPRGSSKREIVSWFLCADEPGLYLVDKWKEAFVNNFKTMSHWPYFIFHTTLAELYDTDPVIKTLLNDMVQINQKIPHSANGKLKWENRVDSYVYKRPTIPLARGE
jgi:hypothetical protein